MQPRLRRVAIRLAVLPFLLRMAFDPAALAADKSALSPYVSRVEGLLRSAKWQPALDGSRKLWQRTLASPEATRRDLASVLMLRALAEAGVGHEPEAVCRWQAAQFLAPQLLDADLSAYGAPGALLMKNGRAKDEGFTGLQEARIEKRSQPEFPGRAFRLPMKGQVVLGAVIGPEGAVRQPRVLRVENAGETLLIGLSPAEDSKDPALAAQSLLLAVSTLEAVCDWRLSPAEDAAGNPQALVSVSFSVSPVLRAKEPNQHPEGPFTTMDGRNPIPNIEVKPPL